MPTTLDAINSSIGACAARFEETAFDPTLHHARSRDPTVGVWLTEDPIAFDGGDANLRRYVGNDPTNHVDPTGLEVYVQNRGLFIDGNSNPGNPISHTFFSRRTQLPENCCIHIAGATPPVNGLDGTKTHRKTSRPQTKP
ncbi:MAG: RHS repeat-associated core domain-containing protein [Pirellulales bacterium]